jgi:glycosyltransferase involved in cell wall biosynthesis
MYHYLQQADVFVSAPKVDNMPMSVLEAFNAGLLVISSNVGGVPFLVADNSTGYLFESDNDKQFAEKMLLAVRKQKKSLEIIKKAKQESEKYRWSNIRNSVLKIYNSL